MALRLDNFVDELNRRGVAVHLANGCNDIRLVGHGIEAISHEEWNWLDRNKPHLINSLLRPSGNGQPVE